MPRMGGPPHFGGEPGTPVPIVHPEDLKAVWQVYREIELQRPGQRVGVCMSVIERACKPGANVQAVVYRTMMLQLIRHLAPEQLVPWMKKGDVDEEVFRVAADIPMQWIGREERHGLPFDVEEFVRRVRGEGE